MSDNMAVTSLAAEVLLLRNLNPAKQNRMNKHQVILW